MPGKDGNAGVKVLLACTALKWRFLVSGSISFHKMLLNLNLSGKMQNHQNHNQTS